MKLSSTCPQFISPPLSTFASSSAGEEVVFSREFPPCCSSSPPACCTVLFPTACVFFRSLISLSLFVGFFSPLTIPWPDQPPISRFWLPPPHHLTSPPLRPFFVITGCAPVFPVTVQSNFLSSYSSPRLRCLVS